MSNQHDDDDPLIHIQVPSDIPFSVAGELEFMGASFYTKGKEIWCICRDEEQYDYIQEVLYGD